MCTQTAGQCPCPRLCTIMPGVPTHPPRACSCRDPGCVRNHGQYLMNRKGSHAELVLVHFKNDALKGNQLLPLSPGLLEPMALLERAVAAELPATDTLFCLTSGKPYQDAYFSQVCSKALTWPGTRATAGDLRHWFATSWRDFVQSPEAHWHELTAGQLTAAAADQMLNSTKAWDAAYDDTHRARGIYTVQRQWAKFREFVREAHLDKASQQ